MNSKISDATSAKKMEQPSSAQIASQNAAVQPSTSHALIRREKWLSS